MNRVMRILSMTVLMSLMGVMQVQADTTGSWVKKSQKIKGSWSIVQQGESHYLVLDKAFKTRNAPDLKFVLSPLAVEQANNNNALQGGVIIAPLQSAKGEQRYKLPDDFTQYSTVLLHCEQYSKLWGAAAIR